jgi:hypothetical protein
MATGWKKCNPATLAFLLIEENISEGIIEDELLAKMHEELTTVSNDSKIAFLASRFSVIASMIRSQPFRSADEAVIFVFSFLKTYSVSEIAPDFHKRLAFAENTDQATSFSSAELQSQVR